MPFMEIGDFNRDGMFDVAFASNKGDLTVLMNQYKSPGPKATNLCNDIGNTSNLLNKPIFPEFPFSSDQEGVMIKDYAQSDDTVTFNGIAQSMPAKGDLAGIPGRMRVADINQDGFPDFVVTLSYTDSNDASFTRTAILLNEDGKLDQVTKDDGSYLAKVLEETGDATELVTFMDIDEDGKLDFVLQKNVEGSP